MFDFIFLIVNGMICMDYFSMFSLDYVKFLEIYRNRLTTLKGPLGDSYICEFSELLGMNRLAVMNNRQVTHGTFGSFCRFCDFWFV